MSTDCQNSSYWEPLMSVVKTTPNSYHMINVQIFHKTFSRNSYKLLYACNCAYYVQSNPISCHLFHVQMSWNKGILLITKMPITLAHNYISEVHEFLYRI